VICLNFDDLRNGFAEYYSVQYDLEPLSKRKQTVCGM
jgi:hypothetical protein